MSGFGGFSPGLPIGASAAGHAAHNCQSAGGSSWLPPGDDVPAALGLQWPQPHHLASPVRKRTYSPSPEEPSRKRRTSEEGMIGDLENLSLRSGRRPRKHKMSLARWRELEDRLSSEQLEDSEPDQSAAESSDQRLVMSDELQQIVAAPAQPVLPQLSSRDNSMALVVWQPPPIVLPPAETQQSAERVSPAPSDAPMDDDGQQPAAPAYDFASYFPAPELGLRRVEESPRFHFGADQMAVCGPFAGFGQPTAALPDDSMDL